MPHESAITIRPARDGDDQFIRDLTPRFAAVGSPPWRDPARMAAFHAGGIAKTADLALAPKPGHALLIATDADDRPLGFAHLHGERSGLTGEEQGYLSTLAVAAEAEGRGAGGALLAAAEAWARARGYRHLALETSGDNHHARAFYGRRGYAEETVKLVKAL